MVIKKGVFCIVLVLLLVVRSYSQTLTGTIISVENEQINSASVLIRDSATPHEVKEYVIARNGNFSITLKNTYSDIIIEVTSNEYHAVFDTLKSPQKDKTYHFNLTNRI